MAESLEKQGQGAVKQGGFGSGVVFILVAKIVFIVTVYLVQLLLPRLLSSASEFGRFSAAMNLIAVLANVVVISAVQTTAKHMSAEERATGAILRHSLRFQVLLAALLCAGLFAFAELLAREILLDKSLTPLLRGTAFVVFGYTVYAPFVGYLNGQRRFLTQAKLDIFFSLLRSAAMIILALITAKALWALIGLSSAAMAMAFIAALIFGVGARDDAAEDRSSLMRSWLHFIVPIAAYHLCLNGMFQLDLTAFKRNVAAIHIGEGMSQNLAAEHASVQAAYYRAAQTFAFVPYQLVVSLMMVIFPSLARLKATGDSAAIRDTIAQGLRGTALLAFGVAASISAAAKNIMTVAYPEDYIAGASALEPLAFALAVFCLFAVTTTIWNSLTHPRIIAPLTALSLVLVLGASSAATYADIAEGDLLRAAALGTLGAMVVATAVLALITKHHLGAWLEAKALLRIGIATFLGVWLARAIPGHGLVVGVAQATTGFVVYAVALFATRELKPSELRALTNTLRRS